VSRDSAVRAGGESRGLGKPFIVEIGQRQSSAPPRKLDGEVTTDAGSGSGYHRNRLTIDFHIPSGFSIFSGSLPSGLLPRLLPRLLQVTGRLWPDCNAFCHAGF
jgi:hypothetical protein